MPTETRTQSVTSPETFFEGERLYGSFIDSLSLLRTIERRYSSAVLHIPELKLKEVVAGSDFSKLKSMGDQLNTLFYGEGSHRAQYDSIIDRAITSHTAEDPKKYEALADPQLAAEAKGLVRAGMVYQLRQKQLETARIARHNQRVNPRERIAHPDTSKDAQNTDSLIIFNHMARDLIESDTGRKMNLDREKVREIIKLIMPGEVEAAEGVEKGISLEVAAKHLLEKLIAAPKPETAVVYGTIKDDKMGGDLILFPSSDHEVMLDVKQTAPNKLRRRLSDEQLKNPGSFWETNNKVFLWLGSDNQVGNKFGLPAEFREVAEHLVEELTPSLAVA